MSETDAVATLADIAETAGVYFSLFITLTFAYLTAAYFVGASLSRFQNLVVSGIYLLSSLLTGLTFAGWSRAWIKFNAETQTILNDVFIFRTAWVIESSAHLMLVSVICASIFFMYDIRRRARTPNNSD